MVEILASDLAPNVKPVRFRAASRQPSRSAQTPGTVEVGAGAVAPAGA